ncbi:MAG: 16S rRNA (uracil(1498)-N(3))-methyltransferase [Rudaea sp.]
MRIPRIYTAQDLRPGDEILLPEQAGEHVARVLRLERGDPLILFNGDGNEYDAELSVLAKRSVGVVVMAARAIDREAALKITLAQSIARGEKMDWILQKATELGVAAIVPLMTERTEVKLDEERAERRILHWQSVIAGACQQSGRTRLPALSPPLRIDRWLGSLNDDALRLALLPDASTTLRQLPTIDRGVIVVVGPEGGLSDQDIAMLRHMKFVGLRLGPRILRAETAGVAALAALQALFGDF